MNSTTPGSESREKGIATMEEIIGSAGPATNGTGPGNVIKDISEKDFMAEVIEASMQRPIIVDFWAPWCGPCKQLTPALEKLVTQAGGKVMLAKVNVDENQGIAQQLRVQSIPTVYAFYQGRPLDGFQGALPESQLRQFIQQVLEAAGGGDDENSIEALLEQADELMRQGQPEAAASLYAQVLEQDAENAKALSGVIRAYIGAGEMEAARAVFDELSEALKLQSDIQGALAALELAEQADGAAANLADLQAKIAQDANDHQARFDLAMALNATGQREEAADALLEVIRRQRAWNDEAARKQLVQFFEAWGPTDPVTVQARKKLSSLLFS
ncbi:thioredoxin [Limibacillus halophilus]|uniref:Thioredoxin n=1 Tax=Limibacillus halophilus TaxID=1579333 RepID=A0A839SR65_9PROT|nr:thioredoxin [Limibacillus halophilus]MBB3063856.1 putative thioredoxin [Limibacillus halophilus]